MLRGAHEEIDPEVLGIGLQALVAIRLSRNSRDDVKVFRDHLLSLPEVSALWHVGGEDDLLVHVVARDTRHLFDLMMDRVTSRDEVARVRTEIVFDFVRKPALPCFVSPSETAGHRRTQ